MIELNDTKVVRFTEKEVAGIRAEHKPKYSENVDWFGSYLLQEYKGMTVVAMLHDPMTNHTWAVLRSEYPMTIEWVEYDNSNDDRFPVIKEKLLN